VVVVGKAQLDAIVSHAREGWPNEICGIVAGRDGRVEDVRPARNVADTPRVRFTMDPHDIATISDDIEAAGLDLVGFYHSHAHTQAYPSPTDVDDWPARWYPEALCFICSLMEEDRPQLRAYHIDEAHRVTEEEIRLE
jgi:proteasome lid subunit RPN8/RPN11